jgi:hypothetical protein
MVTACHRMSFVVHGAWGMSAMWPPRVYSAVLIWTYACSASFLKSGIIPKEFVIPACRIRTSGIYKWCTGEFQHAFLLFLLYYLAMVHSDIYMYIPTTCGLILLPQAETSELHVDL